MLSSATLSTESLDRIKLSLGIDREDVKVLSSTCDRPNIFQQSRSKEGLHLVSIMIRCYDLCFTCSHQEC